MTVKLPNECPEKVPESSKNKITIKFRMIVVKIIGKQYKKEELQENSVLIRKWFVIQCKKKKEFSEKYYDIYENNDIEKQ